MAYLGLAPKNTGSRGQDVLHKEPSVLQDSTNDEAHRLAAAAAALSAVKDAAAAAAGRGKVEVSTYIVSCSFIGLHWCSCGVW